MSKQIILMNSLHEVEMLRPKGKEKNKTKLIPDDSDGPTKEEQQVIKYFESVMYG